MFYIAMKGGLCNQMFQYAFWYDLHKNYHVQLDDTWFRDRGRTVQLAELVSNINFSKDDVSSLADLHPTFVSRVKKHFFKKRTHIIEDQQQFFDIKKYDINKDWYLDGYWQSYRYFENSLEELKEKFFPKMQYDSLRAFLLDRIGRKTRLCSVHIRRGDYIKDSVMECIDTDWFNANIRKFALKNPDIVFIIVSDDIVFCKENIKVNKNLVFCDWNKSALEDLYTIACCDDHIMSNSTFSYWGTLLSRETGTVIYPNVWFKNLQSVDIPFMFPESWRCIE